jgi:hypothetical protein
MKKTIVKPFVFIALLVILFVSCEEEKTLSKDIQNIVPESTLNKITDLGMPINKGDKPTNLTNIYKASPFILKASNISTDNVGKSFSDYNFRLYDQDDANLSIKLDYINGPESGTGLGGFISGSGNDFSVFVKVHSQYSGKEADLIHIISGTIVTGGIKDLYFANFMLDNYGNPGKIWIENEQGRIIYDSDGMSPVVQSLQSKEFNNKIFISSGIKLTEK